MKLGDVVGGAYSEAASFADLVVTGISSDSRTVAPGNLFFALAGSKTDGSAFAADAWATLRSTYVEPPEAAKLGEKLGLGSTPTDTDLIAAALAQ